jgi:flagellar assembly protein FliH
VVVQKMRWSNIVKKDDSSDVQSDISILEFIPKAFNFGTPESASDYLREKESGSDFVMSDVSRMTTGIDEIERQSEEQKIELKVLEKLATLQQEAYQQAFDLGVEEGQKKAYDEKIAEFDSKIENFVQLCESLNNIKQEMIHQNEAHMIKLVYEIACRIAFDHIQEHQESVVQVIKKAIDTAQADENINVLISDQQVEVFEKLKLDSKKDTEFLKKVKFQPTDKVSIGSCIVETNYGVIDASVEQRIIKLWSEIKQVVPKVKSPIEPT